jgi:hypothetical protein
LNAQETRKTSGIEASRFQHPTHEANHAEERGASTEKSIRAKSFEEWAYMKGSIKTSHQYSNKASLGDVVSIERFGFQNLHQSYERGKPSHQREKKLTKERQRNP